MRTGDWGSGWLPDARELFEQFAAAYARGERPRARDYVDRADDREALTRMIERFLQAAPARAAREEDVALVAALEAGEPPLLELRRRRGLRVDDVVDGLVSALALDPAKRAKVKRYYQRLEGGLLDRRGVAREVWQALGKLLPGAPEMPFGRAAATAALPAAAFLRADREVAFAQAVVEPADEARDEIDELFTGAPHRSGS